jgi:ubiquinone/menaquinone biosynthesis C-methylase UbiE
MRVAEVGAGTGWLTVEVARRVGESGRIYSTELNPRRLGQIREAVADAGLTNVIVTEAVERASNLPAGCCDAVFMRRVYHHFDDPSAILRDLRDALVDGGRLVIIEFESSGMLGTVTGLGIDRARLTAEVSADGSELVTIDDWPGCNHYVAVFAKPGSVAQSQPRGGA